jgi:hypothetical protein
MGRVERITIGILSLLVGGLLAVSAASAQEPQRPLRPTGAQGLPVVPYMEGWYDNGDGSVTVSFGYHNRNRETVTVPLGEQNRVEPAQLDGMQPEHYFPGRHHGVFAVTMPASMAGETVWWYIESAGQELSVPGDRGSTAYELDRNPRPQGSLQPLIWFEGGERGSGPEGVVSVDTKTVSVGVPLTLEVLTDDPSVRDPSDPRFTKPLDTTVSWYAHQGPAPVTMTEHPSTPLSDAPTFPVLGLVPVADARVAVPAGEGPARIIATFSEPGEYLVRARLDNWSASDSDGLDQCCWSNAFQRVRVTP